MIRAVSLPTVTLLLSTLLGCGVAPEPIARPAPAIDPDPPANSPQIKGTDTSQQDDFWDLQEAATASQPKPAGSSSSRGVLSRWQRERSTPPALDVKELRGDAPPEVLPEELPEVEPSAPAVEEPSPAPEKTTDETEPDTEAEAAPPAPESDSGSVDELLKDLEESKRE